jgi:molybdate transport system substrate-binding protein
MRRLLAPVVALLVLTTGCAKQSTTTTLNVLAASSLTDVFGALGKTYELSHKNVRLQFTFAGSQELAAQVKDETPADVLATADQITMDGLGGHVLAPTRRVIAGNSLTIAVGPGNPHNIRGLADLARPAMRVVLAADNVPAGHYSRQSLVKAGVTLTPKSEEIDVRTVLTRVRTGEADAGIVYITDLRSAGHAASSVPIPAVQNVVTAYCAAALKDGENTGPSAAFVTWLGSAEAKSTLNEYGFTTP